MSGNTVLVVYPYDNLATNPTMVFFVNSLVRAGYAVDILSPQAARLCFPQQHFGPHVRELRLVSAAWRKHLNGSLLQNLSLRMKEFAKLWSRDYLHGSRKGRYVAILGVDPLGLAIAHQLRDSARTRLGYISFELLLEDELTTPDEFALKKAELNGLYESDFLIIQDEERAKLLLDFKDPRKPKTILIPVAPIDNKPSKTSFLKDHLNIASDAKIVLFQGTIDTWNGLNDWEDMLKSWDRDITLVIHSRSHLDSRIKKYFRPLERYENFRISGQPIAAEDLPNLTASADIGLVSYYPTPMSWYTLSNLQHIGKASGKFSYFMMCGLPVLCNSKTNLSRLVKKARVGEVFQHAAETREVVNLILRDYDVYAKSARKLYESDLNPARYESDFIDAVRGS